MSYGYTAVIVSLTFCAAGMVKGVTGMGLPTIVMGVLGSLLSPLTAATLLLVPSLVTNAWQLFRGTHLKALVRRFWLMMAMLSVGTFAGSTFLAGGNSRQATVSLGIALIAYASLTLFARQFNVPLRLEVWLSPITGLMTGIVTGCTGINVIPAIPYLQALNMERDELVQALGLTFTVATVALGAALMWHRALPMSSLTWSAVAVVPALAGLTIGQAVRSRLSPNVFRRGFLLCLFLLGLNLTLRPFF